MAAIPMSVLGRDLDLPSKQSNPTPQNVQAVRNGLTARIAGHPQAIEPWTFYEFIDQYLGPWGSSGYPIGYGKFYCFAFTSNEKLQDDPVTRDWVQRTMVKLQEGLRDYIVGRYQQGTLGSITEPELRQAAFATHAAAYTDGGLALVVATAPELLEVVVSIPGKEFLPGSGNVTATWKQVLETAVMVTPRVGALGLAAMAGPAHTGLFARAAQKDMQEFLDLQTVPMKLREILAKVQSGEVDRIPELNVLTDRLNATQYSDPGIAALALQVVQAANARKRYVAQTYRDLIAQKPEFKAIIDKASPGWSKW
jgi:hypothetical protein